MKCPDINHKDYKALEKAQGEDIAHFLWDKYNGEVPKEYHTSLDEKLVNGFLKDFGVTTTEYKNLKEDLGIDAVTASDLLTKSIISNQGETITPEVAYFAYSMLGKQNNKIASELRYLIHKWDNYNSRFNYHKDVVSKKKGFIPDKTEWKNTVRDRVIIDFLKEKVEQQFKDPQEFKKSLDSKWTKEDFTIWEKIWKAIKDILAKFSDKFKRNKAELEDIGRSIANEVLDRNYEYFDYKLKEDQIQKYYDESIASDKFAKDLVEFGQKELGLVLTGSLALRKAGEVYRTADESLHDIDWVVPYDKTNTPTNDSVLRKVRNMQQAISRESKVKEAEQVVWTMKDLDWFKKFKEKYPSLKLTNGFYGGEHQAYESFTLQGVINGDLYSSAGYHEEEVSHFEKHPETQKPIKVTNTIKVHHREGEWIKNTGYAVDFFVRLKPFQEEHENYFKLWKEIMIAKLQMGRDKDFRDWKAFIPFTKSKDSFNFNYEGFRHFNYESSQLNAFDDGEPITQEEHEELIQEADKMSIFHDFSLQNELDKEDREELQKFLEVSDKDLENIKNRCS